jgi:hypothetical protein
MPRTANAASCRASASWLLAPPQTTRQRKQGMVEAEQWYFLLRTFLISSAGDLPRLDADLHALWRAVICWRRRSTLEHRDRQKGLGHGIGRRNGECDQCRAYGDSCHLSLLHGANI